MIGIYGKEYILNIINSNDNIYDLIAHRDCLFFIKFIDENKSKIINYDNHASLILNEAIAFSSFQIIRFYGRKEPLNCEVKEESIVRFIMKYNNAKVFKYIIEHFNIKITWKLQRRCALHGSLKMNKIIKNKLHSKT